MSPQARHSRIQAEIAAACRRLGYATSEEHRGDGWRADVFAIKGSRTVAFEVQLSSQSLQRTLHRQERYSRVGATCCWLFEKPPHKLLVERPDLPLFYVAEAREGAFLISLSGRNEVPLGLFVEQFLEGGVRFSQLARTKANQALALVFFEMKCWKCHTPNHVYYADGALRASCNAEIRPEEALWESNRLVYRPEVVAAATRFLSSPAGTNLRLGEIKRRYSRTVNGSYLSFGCYACDSIFGDWFVMEAELEAMNGFGRATRVDAIVRLETPLALPVPHWCYPAGEAFCDQTGA